MHYCKKKKKKITYITYMIKERVARMIMNALLIKKDVTLLLDFVFKNKYIS